MHRHLSVTLFNSSMMPYQERPGSMYATVEVVHSGIVFPCRRTSAEGNTRIFHGQKACPAARSTRRESRSENKNDERYHNQILCFNVLYNIHHRLPIPSSSTRATPSLIRRIDQPHRAIPQETTPSDHCPDHATKAPARHPSKSTKP